MKRIFYILALLTAVTAAHAASFDCGKARSKVEHIICASPQISSLDDRLAASYGTAAKALSPHGRQILKKGQLEWIRYLNLACDDAVCVQSEYKNRLKDLSTAAQRIGPYLFSRVDRYFAKKAGEQGGMYEEHVAYPRIDSPMTETAKKWNAAVAKDAKPKTGGACDGDSGEFEAYFEIKSATANAISVQNGQYVFCDGAAHGMPTLGGATYLLSPAFRLLKAADLFDSRKLWQKFVAGKCMVVLNAKAGEDGDVDADTVKKIASSPVSWTLADKGLLVTFNPYDVLPYALGSTEVLIPWAELRPYLVSTAPVPGK